jgi:hypothetical protein
MRCCGSDLVLQSSMNKENEGSGKTLNSEMVRIKNVIFESMRSK